MPKGKHFGLKCGKIYFRFKKLPMGFGGFLYLMQSIFSNICNIISALCGVKVYVYLNNLFFVGSRLNLLKVVDILLVSDLSINFKKSVLVPVKVITYLGVSIDLQLKKLCLTCKMFNKVISALNCAASQVGL